MKPGMYATRAEVDIAVAAHWAENSYRFGDWEFRPSVGEVVRLGKVVFLGPVEAAVLLELIEAAPGYVQYGCNTADAFKHSVFRLRAHFGSDLITSSRHWGYRFNPEALWR